MPTYTTLKGVSHLGESQITEQLIHNMVILLDWGFVNVGGFSNVRIPTSGHYGGNQHQLRLVREPNYLNGQVWESFRSNWVWETGLTYGTQPIQVSGVYINGVFQPLTSTGVYSHHVNHPLGRIIFGSPISTSSVVTAEYSYKWFKVDRSDSTWFRQLQQRSYRVDDNQFHLFGSGEWNVLAQNRVQLPAVVVDGLSDGHSEPYQIGGGQLGYRQLSFVVMSENSTDRNNISDILVNQKDKTFYLFDKDAVASQNKYPLNYKGSLMPSALMYPDLVANTADGGFRDRYCVFKNTKSQSIVNEPPVFISQVDITTEILMPEI